MKDENTVVIKKRTNTDSHRIVFSPRVVKLVEGLGKGLDESKTSENTLKEFKENDPGRIVHDVFCYPFKTDRISELLPNAYLVAFLLTGWKKHSAKNVLIHMKNILPEEKKKKLIDEMNRAVVILHHRLIRGELIYAEAMGILEELFSDEPRFARIFNKSITEISAHIESSETGAEFDAVEILSNTGGKKALSELITAFRETPKKEHHRILNGILKICKKSEMSNALLNVLLMAFQREVGDRNDIASIITKSRLTDRQKDKAVAWFSKWFKMENNSLPNSAITPTMCRDIRVENKVLDFLLEEIATGNKLKNEIIYDLNESRNPVVDLLLDIFFRGQKERECELDTYNCKSNVQSLSKSKNPEIAEKASQLLRAHYEDSKHIRLKKRKEKPKKKNRI